MGRTTACSGVGVVRVLPLSQREECPPHLKGAKEDGIVMLKPLALLPLLTWALRRAAPLNDLTKQQLSPDAAQLLVSSSDLSLRTLLPLAPTLPICPTLHILPTLSSLPTLPTLPILATLPSSSPPPLSCMPPFAVCYPRPLPSSQPPPATSHPPLSYTHPVCCMLMAESTLLPQRCTRSQLHWKMGGNWAGKAGAVWVVGWRK